ncbi:MAG: amino acid transporter [Deltaproteobacteria bacterium]|nr:amino acid transporter [Deltaproteobacteria bacterium]
MTLVAVSRRTTTRRLKYWFLRDRVKRTEGAQGREHSAHQHAWWQVMCLTGVDYFSTLGYQPGIAFLAAGTLSPLATLILVLLTLCGALPIYSRVAAESPYGQGSIAMLETLLPRWQGKLFVLCLLGFAATDFIITITLSAADATAHIVKNPFVPSFFHHPIEVTLALIAVLGALFLKGFREVISIAVLLVVSYLSLNLVVIGVGLYQIMLYPHVLSNWRDVLLTNHGSPLLMVGVALLVFPKLALGLSGFETGVTVMPLVRGDKDDTPERLLGRIRNTRRMLATAALIMSVMLIASSLVTTLLIPAAEFARGGKANGRALAFLAHGYLGELFGTAYDVSTTFILWFAGASAMTGLLSLVPRYLPRYGMAPEWARSTRPLVLVFVAIAFAVTLIFKADVDAQGGAYATGVLVLMSSAAVAVTLSTWRNGWQRWAFLLIVLVFVYTTITNVIERPEGVKIASFFIAAIIVSSLVSRVLRTTELRVKKIELDETAQAFIAEASGGTICLIANQPDRGDVHEYEVEGKLKREHHRIPPDDPILFLEVEVGDASDFASVLKVKGVDVDGHRVLRAKSSAVPNAIAAFLLYIRDKTREIPHVYFDWTEGNPLTYLFKYVVLGEGDIAPVTREVLRQAEPDPNRRPAVHVGG